MSGVIREILGELRRRFERIYAERLVEVLLYGSYSRSDAAEGSDVDVMVILSGEVNSAEEISRTIEDVSELSLQNDVVISCLFVSQEEYRESQSPLLLNVHREGVAI